MRDGATSFSPDFAALHAGYVLLDVKVEASRITDRALNLVVPKGSTTAMQREVIETARSRAALERFIF